MVKVALSLPAPLLRRIDRLAGKARLSRSAFVRRAVETALRQPAETEALRKARQIYADIAEEDRALAKAYLPLVTETLPRSLRWAQFVKGSPI